MYEMQIAFTMPTISERNIRWRLETLGYPNKHACLKILDDNLELFRNAPGSRANHQAWPGGYLDHVEQTMAFAADMYGMWISYIDTLGDERFDLNDVNLVLFLHDIEKPWLYARKSTGKATKEDRAYFRANKIQEYGIQLTPEQIHALRYVEGMRDSDYDPNSRVMSPLATFCHVCDLVSARIFYDYMCPADDN